MSTVFSQFKPQRIKTAFFCPKDRNRFRSNIVEKVHIIESMMKKDQKIKILRKNQRQLSYLRIFVAELMFRTP